MWKHIAIAMMLPGGIGKKREDWLEAQHQLDSQVRRQYRTTQNQEVRAKAIAGTTHSDFNSDVVAWGRTVDEKAKRGPRTECNRSDGVGPMPSSGHYTTHCSASITG
mmetsp:Transcript_37832/g.79761  ORF Transcript_37832/g.79761 Transcript_37832/m.79761 type:complete len:107 (+) Transcript_37832:97-417(+)